MKKVLCILLTLVMVLTISTTCFAVEGDNTGEDNTGDRNVDTKTYDEEKTIKDEDIPEGISDTTPETVDIKEQSIPEGLPNTGGIPAEAFYAAGALLVVAALILSLKKTKTN